MISKLRQYLLDTFEDPARIDERLASKIQAQKKEKCILSIPSHSPFTRLSPTNLEPIFLFLASLILVIAVAAPYITIHILTGWQRDTHLRPRSNFFFTGYVWDSQADCSSRNLRDVPEEVIGDGYYLLFVAGVICYSWAPIGGLVIVA